MSSLTPVLLKGSLTSTVTTTHCSYCDRDQPSAGGCQITPTRWKCATCWKTACGSANLLAGRLAHIERSKRNGSPK